jgi:hypothetical protein
MLMAQNHNPPMREEHNMRYIIAAAVLAAGTTLASAGAFAVEVRESIEVKGDAATVWAKIGGWCAIKEWHPAVASCEETKDKKPVRTLTLKGGGTIKETQTKTSKTGYQYRIDESPLPVSNYSASFTVADAKGKKGSSTITWLAQFKAKGVKDDEAKKVITGVFTGGLSSIEKSLGK